MASYHALSSVATPAENQKATTAAAEQQSRHPTETETTQGNDMRQKAKRASIYLYQRFSFDAFDVKNGIWFFTIMATNMSCARVMLNAEQKLGDMICGNTTRRRRHTRMPYTHPLYIHHRRLGLLIQEGCAFSPIHRPFLFLSSLFPFFLSLSSSSRIPLAVVRQFFLLVFFSEGVCRWGENTRPQRGVSSACWTPFVFLGSVCLCPRDVWEGTRFASEGTEEEREENKRIEALGLDIGHREGHGNS